MNEIIKAPFPWFGGKSRVAGMVWDRFGDVTNYVEPFYGSGAVLLGRPDPRRAHTETINDKDGFVCNAWRAITCDPEAVAHWADWPINESDLHARHIWLKAQRADLTSRLEGDPDYYDPKIAGWWLWGMAVWIGGGFCSDVDGGPWVSVDGKLVKTDRKAEGVERQRIKLQKGGGSGVQRRRPKLVMGGGAGVQTRPGISRKIPVLEGRYGGGRGVLRKIIDIRPKGISKKRPLLGGNHAVGIQAPDGNQLIPWFLAIAERMRRVRICCGDWARILGPTPTYLIGLTGIFLDPPYADTANRADNIYAEDCQHLAHDVREWAIKNGDNKLLRIALCGYEGEHKMPESWSVYKWKTQGGMASQSKGDSQGKRNANLERIWFSPHCLKQIKRGFFDD